MHKLIKETKIYDGKIVKLSFKEYEYNNQPIYREVISHNGGVAVLAIENDEIYFVEQYRHAVESNVLELPAGCIEKGEDPLLSARRELQEEIGFDTNDISLLGKFYPTPGYSSETIYLYLAENLIPNKLELDEDEFITIHKIKINKVKEMLLNNEFIDGKTQLALLLYLNKKVL